MNIADGNQVSRVSAGGLSHAAGGVGETTAGLAPEDSFLVQIRASSRPLDAAISGRVEHLHSGKSEPFGTLAELMDFLARYFGGSVAA